MPTDEQPQQSTISGEAVQGLCQELGIARLAVNQLTVENARLKALLREVQERYGPKDGDEAPTAEDADPTPLQGRRKGG